MLKVSKYTHGAVCIAAAAGAAWGQCTWTQHTPYPVSTFDGAAVYDSGLQRVLFLNGLDDGGVSIRAWDGTAWTLLSPGGAAGPSNRSGMAAAYDSARGRVVLFGGKTISGQYPGDTWEWDGVAWANRGVGPAGRRNLGMAYDPSRQKTVIFGGSIEGTFLNQTWEWDGAAWTFVAQNLPSARNVSCFAYDPVRHSILLYGGLRSSILTDMWEWNGTAWSQWPGGSSTGPGGWLMADPARGRLILGQVPYPSSQQGHYETWELDTSSGLQNWTFVDPGVAAPGPGAFDELRGKAVFAAMEYNGPAPNYPPAILLQPQGGTFQVGQTVTFFVSTSGSSPLTLQWLRDGQPLANGGNISGVDTNTLVISNVQRSDAGEYQLTVTNSCGTTISAAAIVWFMPECYPNCDNSTAPPILNANDFQCFLNAFAAGSSYANCDGYCNPPPCLNANDFQCFLNKFAAGCS